MVNEMYTGIYIHFVLCRDVIFGLNDFIKSDEDFIFSMMTQLRSECSDLFRESSSTEFVRQASIQQTVSGVVDEVKF